MPAIGQFVTTPLEGRRLALGCFPITRGLLPPRVARNSEASISGALARCVECGQGGLPVGFMFGADALEGFEYYLPPAVVVSLHAGQPAGKPLRSKGVVRGRYLCRAWLGAAEGNMPPIGAQYDPARSSF